MWLKGCFFDRSRFFYAVLYVQAAFLILFCPAVSARGFASQPGITRSGIPAPAARRTAGRNVVIKSGDGALEMTLEYFKFYESSYETVEKDERLYIRRFPLSGTRFVNWEAGFVFPETKEPADLMIVHKYFNPDGTLLGVDASEPDVYFIEPGWTSSWHSWGFGWDDPGRWKPGDYRVELWINEVKAAEDTFTVYDDTAVPSKPPSASPVLRSSSRHDRQG